MYYKKIGSKITRIVSIIAATTMISASLSGCGADQLATEMVNASNNKQYITLSVSNNSYGVERKELEWVELDQLTTHKELRKVWDDKLNIIKFDTNSKNGCMFVDLEGNWQGNNTLYNCFQNKVFVKDYWSDSRIKSDLSQAAMSEFTDIKGESTGVIATVNAYFNLLPENTDKTSGMFNYITRAEAMSAIYRGDTSVTLNDINENFQSAVGENYLNQYAQNLVSYSFLNYANGSLNENTYNSSITKGEVIYMLIKRYYENDYNAVQTENTTSPFKNAGNVAAEIGVEGAWGEQMYELEYCLQNTDDGVTEDIWKALVVANNKGIIASDFKWYDPIQGGSFITLLISAYNNVYDDNNFQVNAKMGANIGQTLYVQAEDKPKETESIGGMEVVVQKIKNIADIDDLIDIYGDELDMTEEEIEESRKTAEGYTIQACDKYMLVDYCHWLNVRVGPGTEYRIKKSVPVGTKVHIVGIVAENGWYRVLADGKISYQCGVYFSDLEGQDTSNLVQEYEDADDSGTTSTPVGEETPASEESEQSTEEVQGNKTTETTEKSDNKDTVTLFE